MVHTEQVEDELMELRILELSPHGALDSPPAEDVPLSPEEVLSVVRDVDEDSSHAPHIGLGRDVRISLQSLWGQIADSSSPDLRGVVVHGRRGLT